jgi:hypothetical protein
MTLARTLISCWLALACTAGFAAAQDTARDSVTYALVSPPSRFEWGCFGACDCPVSVTAPLKGGFLLRRSHVDPLFTWYDVLDVRWASPDHTRPVTITGSGTYRLGGEFALMEELVLDLSFDGGPVQRFSSGLRQPGAAFPEIHTRISLHQEVCFDSVVEVNAKPIGVAGIEPPAPAIAMGIAPNPTIGGAEISFRLAEGGVVDVGVFDLTGRRVAGIVERQWLAGGPHRRTWDGRREDGREAPPGVYRVRVDTGSSVVTRGLIKLR